MTQRICFTSLSGKQVCTDIPLLVSFMWRDPNPPDPIVGSLARSLARLVDVGLPDPWIHGHDVLPQVSHDLRLLATLHAAAAGLRSDVRIALQEHIKVCAEGLPLPKGVAVSFGHVGAEG